MQKQAELPNDIKQMCLWLVRGYDRMVRNYLKKREDIIYESPCSFATYTEKGEECRQYFEHSNAVGNPVADKQERLEAIESQPETKRMRAVEQARLCIGNDIQSEEIRQRLQQGILLNCQSGRNYPFEILNLTEFSQRDFYRRKNRFLCEIASKAALI